MNKNKFKTINRYGIKTNPKMRRKESSLDDLQLRINKFNTKFYDMVMNGHVYASLIVTKDYLQNINLLKEQKLNVYYIQWNDNKDKILKISNVPYSKSCGMLLSQAILPIEEEIIVDDKNIKLYEIDMVERIKKAREARKL